jgi:GDP-4-dehydro-6-deoxy-D-mannose reductase
MRLFITGVSGFVGARLARHALERGDRVAGIFLGERPPPPGVEAVEVDVLDRQALGRAVADAAPDAVVHLAALSHVGESWTRLADYFRVNVLGTEHVLAAAAAAGVERVVLASSAEVYGCVPEAEQPIAEHREPAPRSPYAMTKAAAERLALAAGAVVVRSFNLLGEGQAASFALPSFARQLAAIERGERAAVLRVGNLAARRDFLHVADGAAAYRLLAERGTPGETYNLASGEAVSIDRALGRLMAVAGVEAEVEVDPERMRPADLPLLAGSAERLGRLGWRPEAGLDAALAEIWHEARAEVAAAAVPAGERGGS